jgi:hypothetical protein
MSCTAEINELTATQEAERALQSRYSEEKDSRSEVLSRSNLRLRVASGEVNDSRGLVGFLYVLMRDHVTPGVVAGIMIDHQIVEHPSSEYTNGWLATYAKYLADLMTNAPVAVDE